MPRMRTLPHFPLHTVLFPHLPLPLHIFEERYRSMTRDVLAEGSPYAGRFVVSMITDGREVGGREAVARPVGTICEIRSAEEQSDGRWLLLVVGIARARVGGIDNSGPYAVAEVEELPELDGEGADRLLPLVQMALDGYLATVKRFVARTASGGDHQHGQPDVTATLDQVLKPIHLPQEPAAASYAVAGVLQVELSRKQHLLELTDAATRLRAELDLLRREARFLDDGAMPPIPASELGYHRN
jgi:Lon protease-like protein